MPKDASAKAGGASAAPGAIEDLLTLAARLAGARSAVFATLSDASWTLAAQSDPALEMTDALSTVCDRCVMQAFWATDDDGVRCGEAAVGVAVTPSDGVGAAALVILGGARPAIEIVDDVRPLGRAVQELLRLKRNQELYRERCRRLIEIHEERDHFKITDPVTEVGNRQFVDACLRRLLAKARKNGEGVGVIRIEVDRFKQINEQYGVDIGDRVLRDVVSAVREKAPEGAILGRYGGDEFVVAYPLQDANASAHGLGEVIASVLRRSVKQGGALLRITSSVGSFDARGEDMDAEAALHKADLAVDQAKRIGRGRAARFAPDIWVRSKERLKVAEGIMRGLENGEFIPFFQPQVSAMSGELVGVEVLARWSSPGGEILTPGVFLDVAEEIGAIADIDAIILNKALEQRREWLARGLRPPKVAVNLSAQRLEEPELIDFVLAQRLPRGALAFELLETIPIEDRSPQVEEHLNLLRDVGVGVEIDDFGSGHASIVALLSIHADTVKLDRRLTTPATQGKMGWRAVSSIVQIAKSLGVSVIAEGVETAQQAATLRKLGCDVLQGYYFARPMPPDLFVKYLQRARPEQSAEN